MYLSHRQLHQTHVSVRSWSPSLFEIPETSELLLQTIFLSHRQLHPTCVSVQSWSPSLFEIQRYQNYYLKPFIFPKGNYIQHVSLCKADHHLWSRYQRHQKYYCKQHWTKKNCRHMCGLSCQMQVVAVKGISIDNRAIITSFSPINVSSPIISVLKYDYKNNHPWA